MGLRFDATYLLRAIPEQASEALLEAGKDVFAISQDLCPVDTGALKASGKVEQNGPNQVTISYGNEEVDYSVYVEYGSSQGGPAQPFLTPAFAAAPSIIEARVRERLKRS